MCLLKRDMTDQPSLTSPKVSSSPSESWALRPPSLRSFLIPLTMSSIRRSIHADSIAVLKVWSLTATGSQISFSYMFAIFPVSPSIPNIKPPSTACLALSSVIVRTTSEPQLAARVRGMTSIAPARALYGHC